MHAMSVVENEESLPLKLSQMQTGIVYIYNPKLHYPDVEQQIRRQIELNGLTAKTMETRENNDVKNGGCEI